MFWASSKRFFDFKGAYSLARRNAHSNLRQAARRRASGGLRGLYRILETPGANPLRDAHDALDTAVRAAYGMKPKEDPLAFLLALNHAVSDREKKGEPVVAPGLPPCVSDSGAFVTDDCV
jgi:hypothetical protein